MRGPSDPEIRVVDDDAKRVPLRDTRSAIDRAIRGEPVSLAERYDIATASPYQRARMTIDISERQLRRKLTPAEIRRVAQQQLDYGAALNHLADERDERLASVNVMPYTLDEIAEGTNTP